MDGTVARALRAGARDYRRHRRAAAAPAGTGSAGRSSRGGRSGGAGGPPGRGGSPRLTLLLGLALLAAAIAGGAFAAGMLVDNGRGGGSGPAPLPAVASQPIKPHKGQSLAGAIYAAASPAVVSIRTDRGEGTGFLIDSKGTLVTNDHVVGTATHVLVRFGQDGDAIDGDVLGADPSSDLAVVSIDPAQIPRGARPLRFADSRAVRVGDLVVAIGNPFGLDRTATEGIVSGLGRSIQSPNGFAIDDVIQTDAPINPGNSGGPLLDDGGHVIGVNSQIATAGVAGNIGIGFAIPSNTVRQVAPQLEQGKTIPRPWLGVTTTPASPTHPDGAQVALLVPKRAGRPRRPQTERRDQADRRPRGPEPRGRRERDSGRQAGRHGRDRDRARRPHADAARQARDATPAHTVTFAAPLVLLALLALPLVLAWYAQQQRARRVAAAAFAAPRLQPRSRRAGRAGAGTCRCSRSRSRSRCSCSPPRGRSGRSRCRSSAPRSCSRPTSPARCSSTDVQPSRLSPPSAPRAPSSRACPRASTSA